MDNEKNSNSEAISVLAKQIAMALQYSSSNYDRTYKSIIKKVNGDGTYDVFDEFGDTITVGCCNPSFSLTNGQNVYLTIPSGDKKNTFILGIVPKKSKR